MTARQSYDSGLACSWPSADAVRRARTWRQARTLGACLRSATMKRNFCREDAEEAAAIPHSREGLEVIRLQGLLARRPTMELGRVQDHPATDAVLYQAIAQARLGTVMDLGLSRRAEGRELERVRRQIHAAKQLVYDRCQVPSAGRAVSAAPSCPPRGPVPTAERTLTAMQLRVSLSPLSR